MEDEKVYIMDMYNRWIYPNDVQAKGSRENNYACVVKKSVQ